MIITDPAPNYSMKNNTVPNTTPEEGKKKLTLLGRLLPLRKPHYPPKPSPEEEQEEAEDAKRTFVEPTAHHPNSAVEGAPAEPPTGEVPPVQESIPFEEERRSYERRKPTTVPWVGKERRKQERRAPEVSKKEEAAPPKRNRLRNLIIFTVTAALVGALAYRFF